MRKTALSIIAHSVAFCSVREVQKAMTAFALCYPVHPGRFPAHPLSGALHPVPLASASAQVALRLVLERLPAHALVSATLVLERSACTMTANCAPNLPHVNVRGVRRQPDQRYKHETAHGSVCRAPVPSPAGNRVGGDEELHQLRSAAPGMGGSGVRPIRSSGKTWSKKPCCLSTAPCCAIRTSGCASSSD